MSEYLTPSIQDYLKHIHEMSANGAPASTKDLAARLGIAPASVTGMIQRLSKADPALVYYQKHQGVTLTEPGNRAALEVIRRHRLVETWLVQALGYPWDEVHEEAERLEHVISANMEARIAAALGFPSRDPHGDLIPSAELVMPAEDLRPLSTLRPPQKGTIVRVHSEDSSLLRHLEGLGLVPGAQLTVITHSRYDDNLTVECNQKSLVIGPAITSKIFVNLV